MAVIERIWLATLTKNIDDAGTDAGKLNVTINVDGEDVLDTDFGFMNDDGPLAGGLGPDTSWLGDRQAGISDLTLESPIESTQLTNSSVRVGIRDDDAWAPKQVFLFGHGERRVVPLALELEVDRWMSTDSGEGRLTMPVRTVAVGNSSTIIRRVMLLVYTGGGDGETDDKIQFQISAAGNIVMDETIGDTSQDDLEEYSANWHIRNAITPFTRGDVIGNGGIELSIHGQDAFRPTSLFMFGLDTATGRPNEVVTLVSIPEWNLPTLSTDDAEGQESVVLPLF
jgi:hypothetical protein